MGLIIKREKGDTRSRRQIIEDVDADLANRLTRGRKCSLVCGDAECRETGGCVNKGTAS
jgi:hypothetical protein